MVASTTVFRLVARNVCGQPSPFVIDAFFEAPSPETIVFVKHDARECPHHALRVCFEGEIPSGRCVQIEGDLVVDFDVALLHWRTPRELRSRFELLELSWKGKSLLKLAGLV